MTPKPTPNPLAAPAGAALKLAFHEPAGAVDPKTAERIARLEVDKEIVLRLGLQGYVGREWDAFATVLAQYGVQVLRAWLRTGKIFGLCRHRLPPMRFTNDDDANEVAYDTVAAAIKAFRDDVLIPMTWDPTKGASLKTFFIGMCRLQFPNAYRRWLAETRRQDLDAAHLAAELEHQLSPWPNAEIAVDFGRLLPKLNEDTVERIQGMSAMGFTWAEIAEIDGTTEGAVGQRLYRAREKLKP